MSTVNKFILTRIYVLYSLVTVHQALVPATLSKVSRLLTGNVNRFGALQWKEFLDEINESCAYNWSTISGNKQLTYLTSEEAAEQDISLPFSAKYACYRVGSNKSVGTERPFRKKNQKRLVADVLFALYHAVLLRKDQHVQAISNAIVPNNIQEFYTKLLVNIIRKFASYNADPRLTDTVLSDYRLYHNISMGSITRHSKTHNWHFSPWLSQAINTLRIKLNHEPVKNYFGNRVIHFHTVQQLNLLVSLKFRWRLLKIRYATAGLYEEQILYEHTFNKRSSF